MGRGYGRGRGGRGAPVAQEEDGQVVRRDVAGPPPLFPEIEDLPVRTPPSEKEQQLKAYWRSLSSSWQNSVYNIKVPKAKTKGMKRSLDDFLESNSCKDALDTNHLAKFIMLHPKFVPEELCTSQEKRASNRASSSAAQKELWASVKTKQAATEIDGLLGRFTKLEDQIKDEDITAGSPKAEGPGKAAREDGEEDEQPVDDDEPNEEDFEDDDYLQGQEYDDDEGYEDDLGDDDGGGDGFY